MVAYVIIGLLVISFALWGIQEYFGTGAAVTVADINDSDISLSKFNNQLQWYKQRQRAALGDSYALVYPDEGVIKKEVLDIMLNTEVLNQQVSAAGFQISDSHLIGIIQQLPQFQKDGEFDPGLYERLLQIQRYTKAGFEMELRTEQKLQQFRTALMDSTFVPNGDLQLFQRLSDQSRHIEYALLDVEPEAVSVTAQEIDDHYRENQQLYRTPQRMKFAYIELKEERLRDNIQVTIKDARTIFESRPERYMTTELRKARHILLKVSDEVAADAIEWDEAMYKANDLVKQLREGTTFTDLVKRYSEDSLSVEKGGDIGFIGAGDFASTELEEALFALNVDGFSEPIRTGRGVQILQLIEIKAAKQKPFQEVKEQIVNERKHQLARQHFIEITDELANLVVEQPDNLREAATGLDLEIQQTEWLSPGDDVEILAYPKVKEQAFSDDILEAGLNSALIEVAEGHVIVFRMLEHKPSAQKTLEQVSEEINGMLTMRKAAERTAAKGQEILTQMKAGASLSSLAAAHSLEPVGDMLRRRDNEGVPGMIVEHAFSLPRPVSGQPELDGVVLPDGRFALIELQEVVDGVDQLDEEDISRLSQQINYGLREFGAIIKALRDEADIRIFENNL